MRKTILLLVAIMGVMACGKSDDNNDGGSASKFNPPAWIHGTWVEATVAGEIGFSFEPHNFCQMTGNTTLCYNSGVYKGQVTIVKEESNDKTYSVSFRISDATTHNYVFEKVSDTQIKEATKTTVYTKKK